jgi:hypothetical protein
VELIPQEAHCICKAVQKLKDVPKKGFGDKFDVTVAVALVVNQVAPSTSLAVRVLNLMLTGEVGDADTWVMVRKRLNSVVKVVAKEGSVNKDRYSALSVNNRLGSRFWLAHGECQG